MDKNIEGIQLEGRSDHFVNILNNLMLSKIYSTSYNVYYVKLNTDRKLVTIKKRL
jgi:hypothetical protein